MYKFPIPCLLSPRKQLGVSVRARCAECSPVGDWSAARERSVANSGEVEGALSQRRGGLMSRPVIMLQGGGFSSQ